MSISNIKAALQTNVEDLSFTYVNRRGTTLKTMWYLDFFFHYLVFWKELFILETEGISICSKYRDDNYSVLRQKYCLWNIWLIHKYIYMYQVLAIQFRSHYVLYNTKLKHSCTETRNPCVKVEYATKGEGNLQVQCFSWNIGHFIDNYSSQQGEQN